MRYPLGHNSISCKGPLPRVWITDADNATIAQVCGNTPEQACLRATMLVDAYNRAFEIELPAAS